MAYSFCALMQDYLILYLECGICITKVWQMIEPTVEAVFGVDAGIVWEALNKNGPSVIGDIVKAKGLRRELVYGALGWLGRENKIAIERRGRAMVFSLREAEALQKPFESTTIGGSAPQEQTRHRTRIPIQNMRTFKARCFQARVHAEMDDFELPSYRYVLLIIAVEDLYFVAIGCSILGFVQDFVLIEFDDLTLGFMPTSH
jgi:hypothetical protein